LEVSEARRLKSLEDENRRLKKLLAEAMLDNSALKNLLGKNVCSLWRGRRRLLDWSSSAG
jgi:putative transposase